MASICSSNTYHVGTIGALIGAGRNFYKPNATKLTCITPLDLCVYNASNHIQFIIRCVALGIWSIWYFVLVFQGLTDMARMPYETFRCVAQFQLGSLRL